MSLVDQSFVSAAALFPGRSKRWVNDQARAGRIPGCRKIGGSWFCRVVDIGAPPSAPNVPTLEDATADLRARGVL